MGRVHRGRRHPPVVAPGARRPGAGRLRGGARDGAPCRAQPFPALLDPGRAPLSRLARRARAPRAGRSRPSHLPEEPMKLLHTMLRVGDLQRSVRFYTDVLGMKLLRTTDRPEQKYSLAFVGYDTEERASVLELTYNYGVERYEMGGAFGHIAIGVPDVAGACAKVRAAGGNVTREPGPVKGGGSVIAFVEDPDGYKIEFIERKAP